MTVTQAILIAGIEGVTEFLPISSTGHMIIAEALLGVKPDAFVKAFTVNIQFGAILAVVALYWRRFLKGWGFYRKLLIAFLPAAVVGFFACDWIDRLLESVPVVAAMLLAGGVLLLFVDRWFGAVEAPDGATTNAGTGEVSDGAALRIGCWQCLAMIPGVSRSAATIVGGMQQGLGRRTAAEFSFFLAVPTMAAASAYKLLSDVKLFTGERVGLLLLGNVVAFVVALLAIRGFIALLQRRGFRLFGWYRIVVGAVLLILLIIKRLTLNV